MQETFGFLTTFAADAPKPGFELVIAHAERTNSGVYSWRNEQRDSVKSRKSWRSRRKISLICNDEARVSLKKDVQTMI